MGSLKAGDLASFKGNVTTLISITPGAEAHVEEMLGYHTGRLAGGYFVLVLKQALTPQDFEFDGTTLRSGGRSGLPAATDALDAARPRVHDAILSERGPAGYEALQSHVLKRSDWLSGRDRIAKVLPAIRHDADLPPNIQYPMGGGGLQWKLVRDCTFLVVAEVSAGGATALAANGKTYPVGHPEYAVRLKARSELRRYMEQA